MEEVALKITVQSHLEFILIKDFTSLKLEHNISNKPVLMVCTMIRVQHDLSSDQSHAGQFLSILHFCQ